MTRAVLVSLAVSLGSIGVASPALAASTTDQSVGATAPFDSYSWIYSAQGEGQTFTAGVTGPLESITVFLKDGGSATAGLTVTLRDAVAGLPSGSALATETIPDSAVPTSVGPVTVTFSTPPAVTAGQAYAFTITSTASSAGNQHYELYYKTTTNYSGGQAIENNGPGWTIKGFDNSFITVVTASSSSNSEVTTSPADIYQAVGLPVSGTCEGLSITTLDWAGVATGGWTQSWAQWMNSGRGGATCQRTLHFSNERWTHS
jgi:hypothetical protein